MKNKSFNKKFKWSSFLKICLFFLLIISTVVGIIFGSLSNLFSDNYSSNFDNSYNIKFKVSLKENKNQNTNPSDNEKKLLNGVDNLSPEEKLKQSAEKFRDFLSYSNTLNTGVQYEISNNKEFGYIFTNIYDINNKEYVINDKKTLMPQAPVDILLGDKISTNFIDVIKYQKKDPNDKVVPYPGNYPNNTVIFNSMGINKSTMRVNDTLVADEDIEQSDKNPGVLAELYGDVNVDDFINAKVEEINSQPDEPAGEPASRKKKNASTKEETENTDDLGYKWYVFRDINKLVHHLNFIRQVSYYRAYNVNNIKAGKEIYLNKINSENNDLIPDLYISKSYYEDVIKKKKPNLSYNDLNSEYLNFIYNNIFTDDERTWGNALFTPEFQNDLEITVNRNQILDLYNQYDSNLKQEKTNGLYDKSVKSIIDKYIVTTISTNNYNEWFPDTKELSKDNITDKLKKTKSIKIPTNEFIFVSNQTSFKKEERIINFFEECVTLSPINLDNNLPYISELNANYFFGDSKIGTNLLSESFIGLNPYYAIIIGMLIILFLIAVFISVIYRLSGFMASLGIIFTGFISNIIFPLVGIDYSINSFLASLVGIFLAFSCSVMVMERFNKNLRNNISVFNTSNDVIKKSLMTIVDIHAIVFIISLTLSFMGTYEISNFGYGLIISSVVSFICLFVYFILGLYLLGKNRKTWNIHFYGLFKKDVVSKSNNLIGNIPEIKSRRVFFLRPFLIISILIILVLFIIIPIIYQLGFLNSSLYNRGSVIYFYANLDQATINKIFNGINISSASILYSQNNLTIVQLKSALTDLQLQQIKDNINGLSQTINYNATLQTSSLSFDFLNKNVLVMITSLGFVLIYSLIRFHATLVVPIFIANFLAVGFSISLNYIFYNFVDNYFLFAIIFSFVIFNILLTMHVSVSKTRFIRKSVFSNEEINKFVNDSLWNLRHTILSIIFSVIISSVVMIVFSSSTLIWMFLTIIISVLFGSFALLVVFSYLYYFSIILRQKYISNVIESITISKSKKYDLVNEQIVEGINHFKK